MPQLKTTLDGLMNLLIRSTIASSAMVAPIGGFEFLFVRLNRWQPSWMMSIWPEIDSSIYFVGPFLGALVVSSCVASIVMLWHHRITMIIAFVFGSLCFVGGVLWLLDPASWANKWLGWLSIVLSTWILIASGIHRRTSVATV